MVSPVAEIVSKPIPRMIDFDVDTVISIAIPVNFTRYRWQNDLRLLYGVTKDKARRTPPKRSQALIHPTADPPITTYLEIMPKQSSMTVFDTPPASAPEANEVTNRVHHTKYASTATKSVEAGQDVRLVVFIGEARIQLRMKNSTDCEKETTLDIVKKAYSNSVAGPAEYKEAKKFVNAVDAQTTCYVSQKLLASQQAALAESIKLNEYSQATMRATMLLNADTQPEEEDEEPPLKVQKTSFWK